MRFRFNNDKWAEYPNSVLFSISSKKNHDGKESLVLSASQEKGMIPRNQNGIDIKYSKESVFTYKIIENGDYVIHLRSFQGGFAFSQFNGICSPAYTVLKPNKEILSNGFLENYFTSKKFIDSLRTVTFGIRDGKSISVDQWMTQSLFIPSKNEQEKIIAFIQKINNRIEVQNKIISKYETLIKGISYYIIKKFNGKAYKLGTLAEIYQPQTITKTDLPDNGKYPVYGANGIIGYYDRFNHKESQIMITCRGSTCGTVNLSTPFSWITGNSMVINIDEHKSIVDKKYLYYYLKTQSFNDLISGSGQPQIVRKPLARLNVFLPEISQQIKLRKIIDTFEKTLKNEKEMLSALQKQKAFLLQTMFI